MDGKLFNINELCPKSNITNTSITGLQYADDCVVCAHSLEELQICLDYFCEVYAMLGLTAKFTKTNIFYQPTPTQSDAPPYIIIQ